MKLVLGRGDKVVGASGATGAVTHRCGRGWVAVRWDANGVVSEVLEIQLTARGAA